jgi:AP endonuclease-2
VILEFPAFVLIGVYSPATRDDTRTEFRQAYIDAIDIRVRNLVAMGKQVFLCGDLNIIRSELDTAGLAERLRKEGMTLDEFMSTPSRRFLNHLVFGGRVIGERDGGRENPVLWDLCREFHPTRPGMYTCWETKKNARPGNFGSRIDYVLCSSGIKDWFIDANIQEGLLGSDHCPVYATIGDVVSHNGIKVNTEDIMNPAGMFKEGKRQREWSPKDLLPTSAKLIPEFDRRQSIRDMFFKKGSPSTKTNSTPAQTDDQTGSRGVDAVPEESKKNELRTNPGVPVSQSSQTVAPVASENTAPNSTTASPQKPVPAKRQAGSSEPSGRSQKKTKVALTRGNSERSASGFSQSSLKGFFKPKVPITDANPVIEAQSADGPSLVSTPDSPSSTKQIPRVGQQRSGAASGDDAHNTPGDIAQSEDSSKEKVFDPIVAKESWSKLLGKRVVPKCEHGEDCQILVTKKPGINCGMYHSLSQCSAPAQLRVLRSPCLIVHASCSRTPVISSPCISIPSHVPCLSAFSSIAVSIRTGLTSFSGRSFFMCARPLGPSGDKEQGTEFRCRTFIWSSDWNGRQ